jgi:UDP:flavonoid glycosyltransferase YjiC (YdhE family)
MTRSSAAPPTHRIAYFISPHGFGHAARAAGIMAALLKTHPALRFDLFTTVPRWFFEDSLAGAFDYHAVLTDIGLVQKTSLTADLPATLQQLQDFLPFDRAQITALAARIRTLKCALVMCDIAPLGIAVAKQAGVPSVLIENFTWDWLYQEYASQHRQMTGYIAYLQDVFDTADYHIQTEPVCAYGAVDLITQPVSRKPKTPAQQIRKQLGIPPEARVVMITMGGIPGQYPFVSQLTQQSGVCFVIPGASAAVQRRENVVLLPHHSDFFHPDLVHACDAVIGKAGYSTVAEVYAAGIPFGYVTRQEFRESSALTTYIDAHMPGLAIAQGEFHHGSWLSRLPTLLALPRLYRKDLNGADQAARFIGQILPGQTATGSIPAWSLSGSDRA